MLDLPNYPPFGWRVYPQERDAKTIASKAAAVVRRLGSPALSWSASPPLREVSRHGPACREWALRRLVHGAEQCTAGGMAQV